MEAIKKKCQKIQGGSAYQRFVANMHLAQKTEDDLERINSISEAHHCLYNYACALSEQYRLQFSCEDDTEFRLFRNYTAYASFQNEEERKIASQYLELWKHFTIKELEEEFPDYNVKENITEEGIMPDFPKQEYTLKFKLPPLHEDDFE